MGLVRLIVSGAGLRPDWVRFVAAGVVVVVGSVMMFGVASSASAAWGPLLPTSIQLPGTPRGSLSSVACPTATFCLAVGSNPNGLSVIRWDGASWTRPASQPRLHPGESLGRLSCLSDRFCVAPVRAHSAAYAVWDGASWVEHDVVVSGPAGGTERAVAIAALSCVRPGFCMAGGRTQRSRGDWVSLRWNGVRWRAAPLPAGAEPRDISCSSTRSCFAVTRGTEVLRWDGASWRRSPGVDGRAAQLSSLSCPALRFCLAVGHSGGAPYAERWNGRGWSRVDVSGAVPADGFVVGGFTASSFSRVSCGAPMSCVATGALLERSSGSDDTYGPGAFTSRWDGSSWTVAPGVGDDVGLDRSAIGFSPAGVSCATRSACTVVGSVNCPPTFQLAECGPSGAPPASQAWGWNGTSWSIQPTPDPTVPVPVTLNGVACTSLGACLLVGSQQTTPDISRPLAETSNDFRWSMTAPLPGGQGGPPVSVDGSLHAASCPTASFCAALSGLPLSNYAGNSGSSPFAWDGSRWTQLGGPPGPGVTLSSVSCSSSTSCVSVGYNDPNTNELVTPYAQEWDGHAWSTVQPALPAGTSLGWLNDVSCPSARECLAVGQAGTGTWANETSGTPLIEVWNGSVWSVAEQPGQPAREASLDAVSCWTTEGCTAVGANVTCDYAFCRPTGAAIAESWNGAAVTVEPAPPPTMAGKALTAISCASGTACTAVGPGAPIVTWDGSQWTLDIKASAIPGVLNSVSCTQQDECVAVGDNTAALTAGEPLIERSP